MAQWPSPKDAGRIV